MAQIALGLVGYYQFIRGYPLGPELKEALQTTDWQGHDVDLKEMNWGPVAIVQEFQANKIIHDRIVLIAAVDRPGRQFGEVHCRQWIGGELDVMHVQDRIFEAVTGIISVDNLLVIGEYFKIWPKELVVIEVELPDTTIGNFVLDEIKNNQDGSELLAIGENPITPEAAGIVNEIVEVTSLAVKYGISGMKNIQSLSVEGLNPLAEICHNQLVSDTMIPDGTIN